MADLTTLDRQRIDLESNISKLRAALKSWQTWETEYDGLKEELSSLDETATTAQLDQLCTDLAGQQLDRKAIRDILGLDKPPVRTPLQAARVIDHREDYVRQNITTLSTQLRSAEYALADLDPDTPAPDHDLPIYEINEELDDNDKVISSKIYQPEAAAKQIQEILSKAGIKTGQTETTLPEATVLDNQSEHSNKTLDEATHPSESRKKSVSFAQDTKPPSEPSRSTSSASIRSDQKSVSFSPIIEHIEAPKYSSLSELDLDETFPPDSKVIKLDDDDASIRSDRKSVSFSPIIEHIDAPENASLSELDLDKTFLPGSRAVELDDDDTSTRSEQKSVSFSPIVEHIDAPKNASLLELDLDKTFLPGSKVIELDDDDNTLGHVVIPDDESPDDARLRREMLQYSLSEVGSVVAQLDLEELLSDDQDVDDDTDFADTTSVSDMEDEDEHGRTRNQVVTAAYRKRMLELEKKLDARMLENVGPNMPDTEQELDPRHAHRLVIRERNPSWVNNESETKSGSSKKSVRFKDTLDVRHLDKTSTDSVEYTATGHDSQPKKESRFKRARQIVPSQHAEPKQGLARPKSSSIIDDITERETASIPKPPKHDTDADEEDDPELQRRQLATEYYRLRNALIQQQEGGFKASPEEEYEPLMEERDGKVRKVSRFRAARVGGYKADE